jgi:hypothetical protein
MTQVVGDEIRPSPRISGWQKAHRKHNSAPVRTGWSSSKGRFRLYFAERSMLRDPWLSYGERKGVFSLGGRDNLVP